MSHNKLKAIFVRHGQSTANAGHWNQNFAEIELTELGQEQARTLAESWEFTPSRIIVSPFVRTVQTARPTLERFPAVPVETWDIHEFTYWDIANWNGSAPELRQEEVFRFWGVGDPHYRQSQGAETFAEMLVRADKALARLQTMSETAPVVLFTHGHFIQAVRHQVLFPKWSAQEKMLNFRSFDEERWVQNTQRIAAEFDGQQWQIE